MPVHKILDEMPYEELLGWFAYLEMRPVDWRDDDRTFKFLQTQGYKGKPGDVFPSLRPIYTRRDNDSYSSLKGSFFFQKMMSAVGGDKLDFNQIEGNTGAKEYS
jgi:hypothetical protein